MLADDLLPPGARTKLAMTVHCLASDQSFDSKQDAILWQQETSLPVSYPWCLLEASTFSILQSLKSASKYFKLCPNVLEKTQLHFPFGLRIFEALHRNYTIQKKVSKPLTDLSLEDSAAPIFLLLTAWPSIKQFPITFRRLYITSCS